MQLQFLALVEIFLKQLNGCSFLPGRNYYFFYDLQFFPLCEIRVKAVDAQITWSWHSEGIMFGMDQKDCNSSDEVQIKRSELGWCFQGLWSLVENSSPWERSQPKPRRVAWNMKRLTEGHHQEWSLRLNSIQHEKTHKVQTWHLVVCFFSRNVHPYSFLCGPVLLSARVAVDVSDSDDEFGLPYRRLSPSSSDAVHLRRPYTKRERSNEWEVDKARSEPIAKHEKVITQTTTHNTPQHTTPQDNTTHHKTTTRLQHHTETETETDRDRETEREEKKTREDEREDERENEGEDKHGKDWQASRPVNSFWISANYLFDAVTVFNFLNYLLLQFCSYSFFPKLILHKYSVEG